MPVKTPVAKTVVVSTLLLVVGFSPVVAANPLEDVLGEHPGPYGSTRYVVGTGHAPLAFEQGPCLVPLRHVYGVDLTGDVSEEPLNVGGGCYLQAPGSDQVTIHVVDDVNPEPIPFHYLIGCVDGSYTEGAAIGGTTLAISPDCREVHVFPDVGKAVEGTITLS